MTTVSPIFETALRMGDNCLILGQRVSQWCGHAPVLEEDIALANIALDLIGQAQLWLELAGAVEGKGRSADDLAYLRDVGEFRNLLLVELPNGDFGHTLVRQYLFDVWHYHMLLALSCSREKAVAEIAAKAIKEVTYHLERSSDLVVGLGDGTPESHARIQQAVDHLWMYTGEMFVSDDSEEILVKADLAPPPASIKLLWDKHIRETLERAMIKLPEDGYVQTGGRRGVHTEHLGYILAELQFLQRAYPGADW